MFQFVLVMGMVIVLAVFAVHNVGGMNGLVDGIHSIERSSGAEGSILSFLPDVHSAWMPLITFFVYIAVNWWASWYPGAEPGGGGFIAQRILSAKDERHSLLATLWFNIAHYALRPWPWILVALVAIVRFHGDPGFAADPESGFIRVLITDLPPSLRGLMIAGFFAAYMSTIATELNWGASYLMNDLYRRFLVPRRSERHYVIVSQLTTMSLMVLSAVVCFFMESIADAWKFIIAVGAGTGLVYLLRWFWWRINAWSEVAAMTAAFVTSLTLQVGFGLSESEPREFAYLVLITVAVTTIVWLAVTFLTRPEPKDVLLAFYRKVRPSPALWAPIAREATDVRPQKDGLFNLMDWLLGVAMIYAFLFGAGNVIFGRLAPGIAFLACGLACGALIYRDLSRRGWKAVVE
jgi:SSS family solute:Na+ symporter